MAINQINSKNPLLNKPLHDLYTDSLLNALQLWEDISMKWDDKSFVLYKKAKNEFGVRHNSAWIGFVNNPMTQEEMENVLNPIISHADNFEWKISDDLLMRLKNIFWKETKKNKWETLTINDILININLDTILNGLDFNKQLLSETEHKMSEWLVKYLDNSVNILNELISLYPENSVIKNKLVEKKKYLESYKKTFSDWKFIEWIKNNISDLNNLLDILESQNPEWELANQIKDLRNRKTQKDFSEEINRDFNQIYRWDAFAIPYAQFSNSSFTWWLDQWTKAFGELNWWDKWSEKINRLWKKQEPLMDDNSSFKEKEKAFEAANNEYLKSLEFILWTGCSLLPSNGRYYKDIQENVDIDKFIWMPCSDVYPAILQKTTLPFYLKDLYHDVCDVLWEKSLDKSISQYIEELKNPSWFAKIGSVFNKRSIEKKIENLTILLEKVDSLRIKFDYLEKQIRDFEKKRIDDMIIISSEFGVSENFAKINNTNIRPNFAMSDQDKWLDFMRKN